MGEKSIAVMEPGVTLTIGGLTVMEMVAVPVESLPATEPQLVSTPSTEITALPGGGKDYDTDVDEQRPW